MADDRSLSRARAALLVAIAAVPLSCVVSCFISVAPLADPGAGAPLEAGADRNDPVEAAAISRFRSAVLADGPLGYWRLGDLAPTGAKDETHRADGAFSSNGNFPSVRRQKWRRSSARHVDARATTPPATRA